MVRLEICRQGKVLTQKATKRIRTYLKGCGKSLIDFKQEKHDFL